MLTKYKSQHVWQGKNRCYEVNGQAYPGVTTVLSATKPKADLEQLQAWRDRVGHEEAARITATACSNGTALHGMIEDYLTAKQNNAEFTTIPGVHVEDFWSSIQPVLNKVDKPLLIEGAVYHPMGFAGTADFVGVYEGVITLIDWKSSGKPKRREWVQDYLCQLAAYIMAVEFVYHLKISQGLVAIALRDQPAQTFLLTGEELEMKKAEFTTRCAAYHAKHHKR